MWTNRLVGPSRSPRMSRSWIIRYPVWRQRIGRQYWATVLSVATSTSSRTRNIITLSCGQLTVNVIFLFHDGLNPLFRTTSVSVDWRSAAIPWTSTWFKLTHISILGDIIFANICRCVDTYRAFSDWLYRVAPETASRILLSICSPIMVPTLKLFHWRILWKICNNVVTKYTITP